MGESTLEWAKKRKVSAAQSSRTNAVCEDCGRKWTATLTEVPVTILIKDLDEYYKKLSHNLLEAVEPSMVLCVFRPSDRDVWDTDVTLSVVAPRQENPYHWRINHKFSGPAAASGCQISIWKVDQSFASKSDDVHIEQDIVTVKAEIKEEMKEEDEVMVEDVSFDPLAGNRSYEPDDPDDQDDPEPDWMNENTDTLRCLHSPAKVVKKAYQISASSSLKRFATASHADIAKIREDRHEEKTKKCTKWAANLFNAWYGEKINSEDFDNVAWETLSKESLDKVLSKFYVEMRRQDGKPYSKGAYISIRNGLQRHLANEPWGLNIALGSDPAFTGSNSTMVGIFKCLAKQGLDVTKHHDALKKEDLEKLKFTGVIGINNPQSLQYLVWLNIAMHFGRRRQENYREMQLNTFEIQTDASGRRYLEQTKSDKIGNSYIPQGRMYEVLNDEYCPIRSFELYISLLNEDINYLWQRPNRDYLKTGNWYHKRVIGVHTLGGFLKNMCKAAGIKTHYTNHCTRVTASVILNEAGFGENDVRHVTGHGKSYRATENKKMKMAETISSAISSLPPSTSPSSSNPPPSPPPLLHTFTTHTPPPPSPPPTAVASSSTEFSHPVNIQDNDIPFIDVDKCKKELSEDYMGK